MKRLLSIITILVLSTASYAQEEFIEPSHLITKFNFVQFTGGVILLQGRFDNYTDTLNFILDTGSGGISLDSTTVKYFGLKPVPQIGRSEVLPV